MLARPLLAALVLLSAPLAGVADVLDTTNTLVVDFTVDSNFVPVIPDQMTFALGTVTVLAPITSRNATLFDGSQPLGTAIETNFGTGTGPLSLNPANAFVANGVGNGFGVPAEVDFTTIRDGSIQGRIEFTVTTGAIDFDPNAIYFGFTQVGGGGFFGVSPSPAVTSVTLVPRVVTGTASCFGDGTSAACPCGATGSPGAGCPNSWSSGGVIAGFGEPSVVADTLRLVVRLCPPDVPGIFFSAAGTSGGTPFGNGLLCTSGSIARLGVVFTDSTGSALSAPDLSVLEGLQPGDVRRYQFWVRDLFGSCGGGFNTTNAFDVQW